jgi:hypothetical protein
MCTQYFHYIHLPTPFLLCLPSSTTTELQLYTHKGHITCSLHTSYFFPLPLPAPSFSTIFLNYLSIYFYANNCYLPNTHYL